MTSIHSEDLRPKVDAHICVRCRNPMEPGDRFTIAYIVQEVTTNMMNIFDKELVCKGTEFETFHIDCHDPKLKKVKNTK